MSSSIPPQLQEEKTSIELANLSRILQLLHHRSRNQHRRSAWYRHFNTMRRHLQHLLKELTPEAPMSWPPSRKRKKIEECELRVEQRLQLWADVLVSKWFSAFSQILADKRFAALGLVLLAALGRLASITGVLERIEDGADEDVRRALEEFAQGEGGRALRSFEDDVREIGDVEGSDDIGIVVERAKIEEDIELMADTVHDNKPTDATETEQSLAYEEKALPSKKKRKKSKSGDAIDGIFARLF
jgi:ribonuclease MRP protein subunit RMP1